MSVDKEPRVEVDIAEAYVHTAAKMQNPNFPQQPSAEKIHTLHCVASNLCRSTAPHNAHFQHFALNTPDVKGHQTPLPS